MTASYGLFSDLDKAPECRIVCAGEEIVSYILK